MPFDEPAARPAARIHALPRYDPELGQPITARASLFAQFDDVARSSQTGDGAPGLRVGERPKASLGEPIDAYLLQIWPAPAAPPAILKVTSRTAGRRLAAYR